MLGQQRPGEVRPRVHGRGHEVRREVIGSIPSRRRRRRRRRHDVGLRTLDPGSGLFIVDTVPVDNGSLHLDHTGPLCIQKRFLMSPNKL